MVSLHLSIHVCDACFLFISTHNNVDDVIGLILDNDFNSNVWLLWMIKEIGTWRFIKMLKMLVEK